MGMAGRKYLGILILCLLVPAWAHGMKRESPIKGSISVAHSPAKDFPRMAKISMAQAVKTARSKIHGKALSSNLEEEDGFLVYAVEIQTASRSMVEVLVDAGSGKIVATTKGEQRIE